MIVYPYGSSHCRNVFCEESFGCEKGTTSKANILNKWASKGLHVKDADMNGVNERSMLRFIKEPYVGDPSTLRCYMFGEIDIRVNCSISPGNEIIPYKDRIETYLVKPFIDIFVDMGANNQKTVILAVQPPMFADKDLLESQYMYRWDKKLKVPDPRPKWTNFMNSLLEQKCKENNMTFFDPWTSYELDENGFMPSDQCDGICHIKDASLALEETMSFLYNKFIVTSQ